jgi:hypothetical protein
MSERSGTFYAVQTGPDTWATDVQTGTVQASQDPAETALAELARSLLAELVDSRTAQLTAGRLADAADELRLSGIADVRPDLPPGSGPTRFTGLGLWRHTLAHPANRGHLLSGSQSIPDSAEGGDYPMAKQPGAPPQRPARRLRYSGR